jgi:hypothetical protein
MNEHAAIETFAPWQAYLLYYEGARARREIPLSYAKWAELHGFQTQGEEDDEDTEAND